MSTEKQETKGKYIPDSIAKGTFLLVGSGESYFTEFVKGPDLVTRMMAAMYGDNPDEWSEEDKKYWIGQVFDEDNWSGNPDFGPTYFKADIGETDHIELIRIEPQQIIDALNAKSEWIRVEDRLPEKERALQTFIVSLNGKVFPTQFTVIAWRDLGVTHWRELPEPPNDGGGK